MAISFQRNNPSQRLFATDRRPVVHFFLVIFLSLLLMIGDVRYNALSQLRSFLLFIVSPLHYVVDYPVRVVGWVELSIRSKASLVKENAALRYRQTMLYAKLQRLIAIQAENSHLKALLLTSSAADTKAMAAEILAVDTSVARQLVIVNKGRRDGVAVGQPVLDAKGIMGQVIDVGYMTSTVLLISDSKSAVPVRDTRTGEHAILVGLNTLSHLSLINLPKTSGVRKGDLLVTSGLGFLYPEGYPVGRVLQVKSVPGESFIQVEVAPVALLNQNRLVLLIWPDKEQAQLARQVNQRFDHLAHRT